MKKLITLLFFAITIPLSGSCNNCWSVALNLLRGINQKVININKNLPQCSADCCPVKTVSGPGLVRITQPGSYALTSDASGISIETSDVTLNLCGNTVTPAIPVEENLVAIHIKENLSNITVFNGTIEDPDIETKSKGVEEPDTVGVLVDNATDIKLEVVELKALSKAVTVSDIRNLVLDRASFEECQTGITARVVEAMTLSNISSSCGLLGGCFPPIDIVTGNNIRANNISITQTLGTLKSKTKRITFPAMSLNDLTNTELNDININTETIGIEASDCTDITIQRYNNTGAGGLVFENSSDINLSNVDITVQPDEEDTGFGILFDGCEDVTNEDVEVEILETETIRTTKRYRLPTKYRAFRGGMVYNNSRDIESKRVRSISRRYNGVPVHIMKSNFARFFGLRTMGPQSLVRVEEAGNLQFQGSIFRGLPTSETLVEVSESTNIEISDCDFGLFDELTVKKSSPMYKKSKQFNPETETVALNLLKSDDVIWRDNRISSVAHVAVCTEVSQLDAMNNSISNCFNAYTVVDSNNCNWSNDTIDLVNNAYHFSNCNNNDINSCSMSPNLQMDTKTHASTWTKFYKKRRSKITKNGDSYPEPNTAICSIAGKNNSIRANDIENVGRAVDLVGEEDTSINGNSFVGPVGTPVDGDGFAVRCSDGSKRITAGWNQATGLAATGELTYLDLGQDTTNSIIRQNTCNGGEGTAVTVVKDVLKSNENNFIETLVAKNITDGIIYTDMEPGAPAPLVLTCDISQYTGTAFSPEITNVVTDLNNQVDRTDNTALNPVIVP